MDCTELKCARIRRGKSTSQMAQAIGKSDASWGMKERGEVSISLDEAGVIGRELALTEQEFIAIFFDGNLPFRKE